MASTYLRRHQWWIKFQHPVTKEIVRESLETAGESRAELLRQRVDLEVRLLAPRFQEIPLPDRVRTRLRPSQANGELNDAAPAPAPPSAPLSAPKKRVRIEEAARCYLDYITSQNSPETRANKVSMLRRFLGPKRAEAIVGPSRSKQRFGEHRPKLGSAKDHSFKGVFLDEVTAGEVQQFIARLGVTKKTQRHSADGEAQRHALIFPDRDEERVIAPAGFGDVVQLVIGNEERCRFALPRCVELHDAAAIEVGGREFDATGFRPLEADMAEHGKRAAFADDLAEAGERRLQLRHRQSDGIHGISFRELSWEAPETRVPRGHAGSRGRSAALQDAQDAGQKGQHYRDQQHADEEREQVAGGASVTTSFGVFVLIR